MKIFKDFFTKNKEEKKEEKQITWNQNPQTEEEYQEALNIWKKQSFLKKRNTYSGEDIRNTIGRSERTLHCLDDGKIELLARIKFFNIGIQANEGRDFQINYSYKTRYLDPDVMSFNNFNYDKFKFTYESLILFHTFCDTTPLQLNH